MAGISGGYNSNSIQMLFSGLNGSSNRTGYSDMLGINYNDYATIRSGSYYKLMKAYYSETGESGKSSTSSASTSTSKDKTKALARMEEKAEDLKDSADVLLKKGTNSVFEKTRSTDEEGNTTYGYNTDKIYKAVNDFVDKYNSVIAEAGDSKVTGILSSASSMVNMTKVNEKLLNEIGITRDKENKLSIDEETFKKADMDVVKSLFNSTGSYGYQISAKASMIDYYAQNEALKANTYNKNGMYTYNYNTGEIYSSNF